MENIRTTPGRDVTKSELTILLSDIYKECEDNINNKMFIIEVMVDLEKVDWNEDVVAEYGGDITDLVVLLNDYNTGEFRNVSTNDIMFGLSLLIYYTMPTRISPSAERAMSGRVQKVVTGILMGRCMEMIKTYRKFQLVNNKFLKTQLNGEGQSEKVDKNINNKEIKSDATPSKIARWEIEKRRSELSEFIADTTVKSSLVSREDEFENINNFEVNEFEYNTAEQDEEIEEEEENQMVNFFL